MLGRCWCIRESTLVRSATIRGSKMRQGEILIQRCASLSLVCPRETRHADYCTLVKCWDRYGKPWNVVRVSPEGTSYSQRPLPGSSSSSRPPSSAPRPPSQQWSPPPHPPQQQFSPPPQQPYYPQQWSGAPPQPHYSAYSPAPTQPFVNRPPPNALVVQAGDPRIGGQLCLNCNGRGFITSGIGFLGMGFEDTCGRCRGTGRVF